MPLRGLIPNIPYQYFAAGGGRSGVRMYKVLPLLLFLSFVFCSCSSSSLFHLCPSHFLSNFCLLYLFNCKMRSSIAFGANNVALPSTISRKQDHEIAKLHIFLAHGSAPNLTNAMCTRGVAPAGFKTSIFLTFSTHFCFSQKTYF